MKTADWKSELAALYALGTLYEPDEVREAEALLSAHDEEFQCELDAWREVIADLALASPGTGPKTSLRDRVLAGARPPDSLPSGLAALVTTGSVPWRPAPFPGVSAKRLFQDTEGNISWMVKLEPGAVYPRHRHTSYEHCLVLEGEVQFDEYVLRAGDYEVANPHTDHSSFFSPNGAVLFIIANKHDEIFH